MDEMIKQCLQLMQSMNAMRGMSGGMLDTGMMSGCWLGMGLIFILLVGVVVVVGWLIWRAGRAASTVIESPLEIIKRRYARGEITAEQFETMKTQLSQ